MPYLHCCMVMVSFSEAVVRCCHEHSVSLGGGLKRPGSQVPCWQQASRRWLNMAESWCPSNSKERLRLSRLDENLKPHLIFPPVSRQDTSVAIQEMLISNTTQIFPKHKIALLGNTFRHSKFHLLFLLISFKRISRHFLSTPIYLCYWRGRLLHIIQKS